jgi:hypothetical protein
VALAHVGTGVVAAGGGVATNPTTVAPAYPAGYTATAGDLAVVTVVSGHDTEATPTITSGWDQFPGMSASGGGGTFGAGTGPRRLTWFARVLTGGDATPTVSLAGTNTGRSLQACITIISKAGGTSFGVAAAFGAEATAGTGWTQATSTNPGITSGDLCLLGYAVRDDQHAAFSAMGVTATSATFGTVSERADAVTGNGNDQGLGLASVPVTAGTASAAPVVTATIGTSESGEIGVLRVRELVPVEGSGVGSFGGLGTATGGPPPAPVRSFDGSDQISFAVGALASMTGAGTVLFLLKRTATGWAAVWSLNGTGSSQLIFTGFEGGNTPNRSYHVTNVSDDATGPASPNFPTADGWIGVAWRKGSGTDTIRTSKYVLGTATWTHADSTDQNADGSSPGASGVMKIGAKDTGFDFFTGLVAGGAVWEGTELSDGTLESIILSAQAWLDASPDWMVLLNQASTATTIEDITGNGGDQSAITGTSVVTDDAPPGFDFTISAGGAVEGSAAGAFGGLGVASGIPRTLGSGAGTFGGLGSAAGIPRTLGTAAGSFGGLGSATGQPRKLGTAAAGAFGFTGTTTGTTATVVSGAGAGAFGGLGSSTGQPRTLGVAAGAFGGLGVATGAPVRSGSGTAAYGGLGTATGQPRKVGAAAASFGGLGSATGRLTVLGAALGQFGFTGTALGTTAGTTIGSGVGSFGGLGSATGQPRTLGSASAAFGGLGVASGQPFLQGAGEGLWGGLGAATGVRRVLGAASGLWGFLGTAEVPPEAIPGRGVAYVGAGVGSAAYVDRPPGTAYVDWTRGEVSVG